MMSQDFKIPAQDQSRSAPLVISPHFYLPKKTLFHLKSERGRERAIVRQPNKVDKPRTNITNITLVKLTFYTSTWASYI